MTAIRTLRSPILVLGCWLAAWGAALADDDAPFATFTKSCVESCSEGDPEFVEKCRGYCACLVQQIQEGRSDSEQSALLQSVAKDPSNASFESMALTCSMRSAGGAGVVLGEICTAICPGAPEACSKYCACLRDGTSSSSEGDVRALMSAFNSGADDLIPRFAELEGKTECAPLRPAPAEDEAEDR